ncbi:HvfC/BufC N-terminal domain-containing protein [Cochlodiniinecator piscidefendens]|uniref:HvfC/BufC N-terminal domain-containing protein n=1 Tax=Cochlodiniinecator piscidefendens TaxID=2715756 RepID=UPI00140D0A4A|nr:DNA-binding domain-containing protein [Cochlodiniinecator piscidefendens]
MNVTQSEFRAAIFDANLPIPEGLTDPDGRPAGKRFSVYRNNVAVSLTEALIAAFPIIHKLLGDAFFRALAGVFLRQYPPTSPLMMFYGTEMPDFLKTFEPVKHLGYLPDIARIELARRHSYHAKDSMPIAPEALQNLPPERLMAARFSLSEAVYVVTSDWPIHAIWRMNTVENAPKPAMQPEAILVTRPELDPVVTGVSLGAARFVTALKGGQTFAEAFEAATTAEAGFDLTPLLGVLITGAAIIQIQEGSHQ